ncbi:MAG TPA: ABC transporter ATP-binding protein [Accumulibacter sp.]|jgi:zinc/manganese transport system ATP-binding protein|nr:ABC transporter ATP-binding protein [Accumulibacter sp.]HPP47286.1 ABC transporter ATP-binding protein [Accumulibacter sp.]
MHRHLRIAAIGAPILSFENLTLGYNRHPAVHHLRGQLTRGSLLAIVGPNGAGKSTLLKAIAGILRPLQGHIDYHGLHHRQIAYLTQEPTLDLSFPITVHDFVAMGLWRTIGGFAGLNIALRRRIDETIAAVGLTGLKTRPIGAVSGGQLQRALFARVMLQDASLVLLDEPYRAIDAASMRDLSALVQQWHAEGRTVIAVLHDLDHVRREYPQTLLLAREAVAYGDTTSVLSEPNLQRARQLADDRTPETEGTPVCQDDISPS